MSNARKSIHDANNALMIAMGQLEVLRRRQEGGTLTEEEFQSFIAISEQKLELIQTNLDNVLASMPKEDDHGKDPTKNPA